MKTSRFALFLPLLLAACQKQDPAPDTSLDLEYRPGGATTVAGFYSDAFEQPCANLNASELSRHLDADLVFESIFVTAPAAINGGLGPLFNQNSCVSCHGRNGRAAFPESPGDPGGLLFRLSLPGAGSHGEPLAVPGFGGQLQTKAVWGVQAEARVDITFQEEVRQMIDGTTYTLRKPVFTLVDPYTDLPSGVLVSPRLAPPVFGLGLLENIPESALLQKEDPNDADGDGISGRLNRVWSFEQQSYVPGRFGWKAGQPTLIQQSAAAYSGDMGITSPLFPVESAAGQPQADPLADDPEIDAQTLELAAFYCQSLAVPAPRSLENAEVAAGKKLFYEAGCTGCHTPGWQTSASGPLPFLLDQTIWPYTDLLLHDMGEGLADNRPEFGADGREWRTPPLWGIGLTRTVNGHDNYLHDGRARSLLEAVLWHGGEAEPARKKVERMSADERKQLIRFLEAL
ncbi:MAG: di-heme oxidoredictase family protein [Saprospiraceae bacterium]